MKRCSFIIIIILYGYGQSSQPLFARSLPTLGPGLAAETWNPGEDDNASYDPATEPNRGETLGALAILKQKAWLLAPVPVAVFSGLTTVTASFTNETRSTAERPDAPARAPGDPSLSMFPSGRNKENNYVSTAGFRWHPHHKEGAPRYYLAAERTGLFDRTQTIKPFASFTVGTNLSEDDMPFSLNLNVTDLSETSALLTWHRFATYNRYDIAVGHKLETKHGYVIDVFIPRHILLGYTTTQDRFGFFAGISRTQEYYPWTSATERGWSERLVYKKLVFFKLKIVEPLYAVFEFGQERQQHRRFTYDGTKAGQLEAGASPYIRIAMESWLKVI